MTRRVLLSCARLLVAGLALSAACPPSAMAGGRGLDHPLLASRADARPASPGAFPDTVRVLAAMVQFQADDDARTTGNGQFDLSAPTDSVLDAPPRDRRYFEQHLQFLQNYYRRVSSGRAVVEFVVVDTVITLPDLMARYSPPKDGSFAEVADLARDTWTAVDATGRVPDFGAYDVFVVFHAGVGRDIDLVGTLGFDPTPFDIPSLYLGLRAFQEVYGPSYGGIPVTGGPIVNSMIIPETESRLLPGAVGDVLLELSINGLLCASLGNYLGLPDLFDTSTGRSGIGRFGLMDGQAIFSYSGLFPPEPSAWEKVRLGWVTPIDLPAGTSSITIPAASLADSLYRVAISPGEYYLVENRNRDARRDGLTVTSVFNGVTRVQTFARDTAGFNAFDVSAIAGVVIDVDEPDWSIPGVTDPEGEFFDGGALIWHIDEAVIGATLERNAVNADPSRRGVDVEEADGSQDIGEQYDFLSPGSGSEEGTPLDFWYAGNSAPVYRNEFSASTFPSATSNDGASTQITVKDFSARGPRMSAVVVRGTTDIRPVAGFPRPAQAPPRAEGVAASPIQTAGTPVLLLGTAGADSSFVEAWTPAGSPALPGTIPGRILASAGPLGGGPSAADLNGDGVFDLVILESSLTGRPGRVRALSLTAPLPGEDEPPELFTTALDRVFSGPAVIGEDFVALADTADSLYVLAVDGTIRRSAAFPLQTGERVAGLSLHATAAVAVTGSLGTVALIDATTGLTTTVILPGPVVGPAATTRTADGDYRTAVATADGDLHLLGRDLVGLAGFPLRTGDAVRHAPVIADLDGDGSRDLILATDTRLWAVAMSGAVLDNFPVSLTAAASAAPVVADVDGNGSADVVVATRSGLIVAVGAAGTPPPGFPLQAGADPRGLAALVAGDSVFLAVAADAGTSFWRTGTVSASLPSGAGWPQYQHDASRTGRSLDQLLRQPLTTEFFPALRAYNWPNPVYDGTTYFRYYVSEDADVQVSIYDMAGDLVAELTGRGRGGLDNEIPWTTGNVQSGVYLARIEASGAGKTGMAIVKVAVVR